MLPNATTVHPGTVAVQFLLQNALLLNIDRGEA